MQPAKKHNSTHLSLDQWIRSAIYASQQVISSYSFLSLKILPPPCQHSWYRYVTHYGISVLIMGLLAENGCKRTVDGVAVHVCSC